MRYIVAIIIGVILMGCSYADDKKMSECRAEEYQYLLGRNIKNIDMEDLKREVRVIEPNMLTDMRFISGRLNIRVDDDGEIIKIFCG